MFYPVGKYRGAAAMLALLGPGRIEERRSPSDVSRHAGCGAQSTTAVDFEIVRAGSGAKRNRPKGAPKLQMVAIPLLDVLVGTIGQPGGQFADFDSAMAEEMIAALPRSGVRIRCRPTAFA